MEQLIAQLAQAMAQGQGGAQPQTSPNDMMAAEGGATNLPMDPASAQRFMQELGQAGQGAMPQAPAPPQQQEPFTYSAPIDPTGDDYFKNELGQDYDRYVQMTPDQRLRYLNDPANGFVPPLY